MNDFRLSQQQREAVRDLQALVAERAEGESRIVRTFETQRDAIEGEFKAARSSLEAKHQADAKATDKEFRAKAKQMKQAFEEEAARLQLEYETSIARINEKAETNQVATKKALDEAIWLTETVFEATESQPREQFENACKGIDGKVLELHTTQEQAAVLLARYRQRIPSEGSATIPPVTGGGTIDDTIAQLDELVENGKSHLTALSRMFVPRLFHAAWPVLFVIVVVIIAIAAVGMMKGWQSGQPLLWAAIGGLAASLAMLGLLYALARTQMHNHYRSICQYGVQAQQLAELGRLLAEQRRDRHAAELVAKRDADLKAAHEKYEPVLKEINDRQAFHIANIHDKYPRQIQEHKDIFDREKRAVDTAYRGRVDDLNREHAQSLGSVQNRRDSRLAEVTAQYESDWNALENRWKSGMQRVYDILAEVNSRSQALFPGWHDPKWSHWTPPGDFAPVIRYGEHHIDLQAIKGGIPRDERLMLPGPTDFKSPALLAFPNQCSMVIHTGSEGRDEAIQVLQAVMFRLLTTLPPGKVRFTIIDPVGLGQNFAGFMHLADYDGAYVTDKIWTEDRHIEQRLLDLTEHMENVIQKYLRNEYETIADYNIDAGEIAEPFRFLVIANFPVNFSETAARRLASIINSGARCGVHTLITVDTRQSLPPGIQLRDLERHAVKLTYDNGAFVLNDDDFKAFPLTVDHSPAEDFVTEKLHLIGAAAKDSSRVEVPFDVIAPDAGELWSETTSQQLRVALGRAGATKLQYLTLGVGTSQHALIAGKTGSGKSTLLHALITNLALWYSPDEVEFYLVDFKKGVEFKTYATHDLAHARAVAIESDREFGLSVLQRLDAELKIRGNLYRDLGVQDLAGYRKSGHPQKLPRTLLIIDEFQELFIEDDKLAQDSALLLDRLVRQGRAFGMHVILGSQTLGGAYSLARSTIGQMGVRIALQCSEADSYLILSDDNAAARLLSRPGEAIYNDASGMIEGNNPFQIVWLPEAKRDQCLNRVKQLVSERGLSRREPQIVFEGNVPADITRNHLLTELLSNSKWPKAAASSAWLGEAIAMKDPTAASFRRQSGANLIVVGQREEAALAMLATSLFSLAAQHAPGTAKFFVLDGSPADSPSMGYLERIAALLPHGVCSVSYRDVPNAINEIAQSLDRRTKGEASPEAIYLMIYGLQRFRMLRQEDDFGFSTSSAEDEAPKPDKQFGAILREGPNVGIHTLAWCDTVNNLNRSLDRQGLKEFELRVLFQMGATDSSNLIDSPLASKLGMHRALFFSEEHGLLEKFRPYALPPDEWLHSAAQQMSQRDTR